MKVLFLYDDVWHPYDVLDRGLDAFAEAAKEFTFERVRTAKDILTPELISEYPVIVNAKSNQINAANPEPWFEPGVTEVCPEDFRHYVERGGGFLSLHSGNAFFAEPELPERFLPANADYIDFVGNHFVGHPPRCEVGVYPAGEHPITEGVVSFLERDEHYELKLHAEDAEVFLKSRSATGGEQIAGYTRTFGQGRLCVLTPGHTLAVWKNSEFQKLLCNAILWCGGKR